MSIALRVVLDCIDTLLRALTHVYKTDPLSANQDFHSALHFCNEATLLVSRRGSKEAWLNLFGDYSRLTLVDFPFEIENAIAQLRAAIASAAAHA